MWSKWRWNTLVIFSSNIKKSPSDRGFAPRSPSKWDDWVAPLCSARHPIEAFFKQKNFNCQASFFSKIWVAHVLVGVSERRNVDQQNRLFHFEKTSCFCFLRAHSRLFRSCSLLQIDFSSDYGPKTKGAKKTLPDLRVSFLDIVSEFRNCA